MYIYSTVQSRDYVFLDDVTELCTAQEAFPPLLLNPCMPRMDSMWASSHIYMYMYIWNGSQTPISHKCGWYIIPSIYGPLDYIHQCHIIIHTILNDTPNLQWHHWVLTPHTSHIHVATSFVSAGTRQMTCTSMEPPRLVCRLLGWVSTWKLTS